MSSMMTPVWRRLQHISRQAGLGCTITWSTTLAGVTVEVLATGVDPDILRGLRVMLPPAMAPSTARVAISLRPGGPQRIFVVGTGEDHTECVADDLPRTVAQELIRAVLEQRTAPAHLHAGAVTVAGRSALLIAPTHGGKSWFAATGAVNLGAEVHADEMVLVDAGGRCRAVERPLMLRQGGRSNVPAIARLYGLHSLRTRTHELVGPVWSSAPTGLDPALVVVLERKDQLDGGIVAIDPITRGNVLRALLANSFDGSVIDVDGLRALASLAAKATGLVIRYSEASAAVSVLRDHPLCPTGNVEVIGPPTRSDVDPAVAGIVVVAFDDSVVVYRLGTDRVVEFEAAARSWWSELVSADGPPGNAPAEVLALLGVGPGASEFDRAE